MENLMLTQIMKVVRGEVMKKYGGMSNELYT